MDTLWQKVKETLKNKVPAHSYKMWIDPLMCKAASEEKGIILTCPNFFSRKRVQDNFALLIKTELQQACGREIPLVFEIADRRAPVAPIHLVNQQMSLPNLDLRTLSGRMLRNDFTFDQFVVSTNNDFAYSAALSMASRKNNQQSSLYLLSQTGMGKSHLSQAVGHHILKEFPNESVYYITAEDFTNEMVMAFRNNNIEQFKRKYRTGCDVLLLEDVHYLTGKERTQTELALTLDQLFECNKKVIFSSCYAPAEIPRLNDKLKSRLTGGLISNIEPPNFRTRLRILQKKAQTRGAQISNNILEYLASELTSDIRQLESGLIGITAKSSLLGVPIDRPLAESVIKNLVQNREKITIDLIKKAVCNEFGITLNDIVSKSRKQAVVRPRHIAIYLARRYTDSPLQAISKSFNRYHATALHSIGVVEKDLKQKGPMYKQVEVLCEKLEGGKY